MGTWTNVAVVQLLSHVQFFVTPWTAAHQAPLPSTVSQDLLKLMSTEWVMSSNHLFISHPLLLLPSIFPSIRVFSSESTLQVGWPKYWSFSVSPSIEYSGLISFRIDWFHLHAVRGLDSLQSTQKLGRCLVFLQLRFQNLTVLETSLVFYCK